MRRDWKPGDVAMVSGQYAEDGVVAVLTGAASNLGWAFCGRNQNGPVQCWSALNGGNATVIRPLVVIDPEVTKGGALLPGWLRNHAAEIAGKSAGGRASVSDDLRYIADQIDRQAYPSDPKPEEPTGLGAVVEDADGRRWVRAPRDSRCDWHAQELGPTKWAVIAVVRVLSEGVTP